VENLVLTQGQNIPVNTGSRLRIGIRRLDSHMHFNPEALDGFNSAEQLADAVVGSCGLPVIVCPIKEPFKRLNEVNS